MTKLGTLLARLGGADADVLKQTTGQKSRFIQMGLVLLSTAGLAVLSMAYALIDGLRAPVIFAIIMGLVWGTIILNLDRLLILTMRSTGSKGRVLLMVAARLMIAALLGIIIATPLTLRIFESEIAAQMILDNAAQAQAQAEQRRNDPRVAELEEVEADIARYESIVAGRVEYSSPNLAQAQAELTAAEDELAEKQEAYDEANLAWRCERYGELCANSSGIPGDGARAEVAKEQLDVATAALEAAQGVVDAKQEALNQAQEENRAANDEKLAADRAEANQQLPEKRERRYELEVALAEVTDGDSAILAQNTGLLARIDALDRLGDESFSARMAHLSVAGLLFMIELLPVLLKALSMMGPPTQYDRISDMVDRSTVDAADRRRGADRRKAKKVEEIENDMLTQEISLGKKANAHVASEMEKILEVALQNWSRQVERTLHASPVGVPAQEPPPQGGPRQNGSAEQRIRNRFNLPWWEKKRP